MTPEIKQRWIAALRSGKYKQGTGTLRSEDGERYCCLGVLWLVSKKGRRLRKHQGAITYIGDGYLPEDLLPVGIQLTFARMNDVKEFDFHQIADVIEQDPSI